MDMQKWVENTINARIKKPMPILFFPVVSLMNVNVQTLISHNALQAEAMKRVADRTDALAAVGMMDLSVEAEAFGAPIRFFENEVPTVTERIVTNRQDADSLLLPDVSRGRTGTYIEAIRLACTQITDRPVFAGVIGPFSLAGRLMDVSEAMVSCYAEPETVHAVLDKASQMIIDYIIAYRDTGANGVMLSEPLAGMLSPALNAEFSAPYVKRIVDKTQRDDFIILYHNCGDSVADLLDDIVDAGAAAYHFGNTTDMQGIMQRMPSNIIAMGNIDPSSQLKNGTPESVKAATLDLLDKCGRYDNFVLSSGCDIPPLSPWENIDAFFGAAKEYYGAR